MTILEAMEKYITEVNHIIEVMDRLKEKEIEGDDSDYICEAMVKSFVYDALGDLEQWKK